MVHLIPMRNNKKGSELDDQITCFANFTYESVASVQTNVLTCKEHQLGKNSN